LPLLGKEQFVRRKVELLHIHIAVSKVGVHR
jgi:hypothetical protein